MTHFMKWVQSYRYCILVAQKYELKYIAASTSLYQPHNSSSTQTHFPLFSPEN